jgi:hypothetical protein
MPTKVPFTWPFTTIVNHHHGISAPRGLYHFGGQIMNDVAAYADDLRIAGYADTTITTYTFLLN